MRIMVDTNVLISALLFPSKKMNTIIQNIAVNNQMILSTYIVEELKEVTKRKFPTKIKVVEKLLKTINYEIVKTPTHFDFNIKIRDPKDYPIIAVAIKEKVDILVTGDKNFTDLKNINVEILTPNQYYEKYIEMP